MKQAIRLGILSAVNLGLVFAFQWLLLTKLGVGPEVDAFFAGMAIPQFVLAIISGSVMHVLVPLLAGEDKDSLSHDAWAFFILLAGLFGVFALLLYLTAFWWVPLSVPGFSSNSQNLTVKLTQIQIIGMVFSAVNGVQWAACHARKKFIWAEVAPILANAFAFILLVLLLPDFGIVAAAWISTLRLGIQTILILPGLGKPVWPNFRKSSVKTAWQRMKPLVAGTAYYKTDSIFDRFLLSSALGGSLSLYYFSLQIYAALNSIINKSVVSPLVPLLSEFYKNKNIFDLRRAYYANFLIISGLLGVLIISFVFSGKFLLGKFIGYGNVRSNDIADLWWIMIWLSGSFVGGVLGQISSSFFYALGDTSTPTRVGVITYSIYIPIKFLLYFLYGVWGLAFSLSCFFVVNFLIQNRIIYCKFLEWKND